jgi:hypothetical protein
MVGSYPARMNLENLIRELHQELAKVNQLIAALEQLEAGGPLMSSNRGRKSMGEQERRLVSARMKKYWSSHRKTKPAGPS